MEEIFRTERYNKAAKENLKALKFILKHYNNYEKLKGRLFTLKNAPD